MLGQASINGTVDTLTEREAGERVAVPGEADPGVFAEVSDEHQSCVPPAG
jgi:hypothetical protein